MTEPNRLARRDHLLDESCSGASRDPRDAIETELERRGVELEGSLLGPAAGAREKDRWSPK
jgi:hypothetical protein